MFSVLSDVNSILIYTYYVHCLFCRIYFVRFKAIHFAHSSIKNIDVIAVLSSKNGNDDFEYKIFGFCMTETGLSVSLTSHLFLFCCKKTQIIKRENSE